MMKKILVAVDPSPHSEQVFGYALSLAKATDASLMLIHVLTPQAEGAPLIPTLAGIDYGAAITQELWDAYRQQREAFEKNRFDYLCGLANTASQAGIKAEFSLSLGDPGHSICELAKSWDADLIVVGRRGLTGLNEWVQGSVSNYVLHHAPCSVLTVQG
ncbi:MAG: universal stress protein [Cyanobacteriota bacterium]|nr:universal stress protein [Cyanobacteriota bacterium]